MALAQRTNMSSSPADNDIYTVLLIIATVFLVTATIVLAYQFGTYYGFDAIFNGPTPLEK
jgi:hypothetical protein